MRFILGRSFWARKGGKVCRYTREKKPIPFMKKVYCDNCVYFEVKDNGFDYPDRHGNTLRHYNLVNSCNHPKNLDKITVYKDTWQKREESWRFKDFQAPERRNRNNDCQLYKRDTSKGDWEV